jgi:hypothetical protein
VDPHPIWAYPVKALSLIKERLLTSLTNIVNELNRRG